MFPLLRARGASVVRIPFHDSSGIILILLSSYVSTFYISLRARTTSEQSAVINMKSISCYSGDMKSESSWIR